MDTSYGSRIKAGRRRMNLTVQAFAERIGVSRATQLNYESGKTLPTVDYIDKCAEIGISPESLLNAASNFDLGVDKIGFSQINGQLFRLFRKYDSLLQDDESAALMFEDLLHLFRNSR